LTPSLVITFLCQAPGDISDEIVTFPTDAVGHLFHSRQSLADLLVAIEACEAMIVGNRHLIVFELLDVLPAELNTFGKEVGHRRQFEVISSLDGSLRLGNSRVNRPVGLNFLQAFTARFRHEYPEEPVATKQMPAQVRKPVWIP
jgi:hypothetical protein